jgi:hypothetical protein
MKKITLILFVLGFVFKGNTQSSCANSLDITTDTYLMGVVNGSAPSLYCVASGNATAGLWYNYTPTQNYTVTITTDLAINQGKDTRFHVYTGTCSNLVCVTGDDDSGSGFLSVASFSAISGTTYTIVFDNRWGTAANNVSFQLIEAAPVVTPTPLAVPVSFSTQVVAISGSYKNGVVDMNGDHIDDIVAVSSTQVQIQQQNISGGFTVSNFTTTAATNLPTWSFAAGDFDGNGFSDLLYGGGSGVTFMKANATGTGFTQVTFPQYVFSQRSNFIDINNDGHLDAFVCHDVAPNVYYLNDGLGNLVYNQGGLGDVADGGNYGSIWVDYDNDTNVDLFIAKCRGAGSPAAIDELHKKNANNTFTNVGVAANMASGVQTWSSAWGDFDNDGYMDALVGASSFASGIHRLMRNNGDGTFTNITSNSGFHNFTGTGIEYVAQDFNNDGFIDVWCAGSNTIMYNNGNLTFSPSAISFGAGALGDLNNDGFIDIMNGNNLRINQGNTNNWIKIGLNGITSNKQGIGARVEIYGSWGKQIRDVRSGDGFRYMSSLNAHFGIGTATAITQVIIRWPSGVVDTIQNPTINQLLVVTESSTLGVNDALFSDFVIYPNPVNDLVTISSKTGNTITSITIHDMNGRLVLNKTLDSDTISLQSLTSGIYLVTAMDSEGNKSTQKIVKQ